MLQLDSNSQLTAIASDNFSIWDNMAVLNYYNTNVGELEYLQIFLDEK